MNNKSRPQPSKPAPTGNPGTRGGGQGNSPSRPVPTGNPGTKGGGKNR